MNASGTALQGKPTVEAASCTWPLQLAPHALPDLFSISILAVTLVALLVWRVGTVRLLVAGAILRVLRSRLLSLGAKAAL